MPAARFVTRSVSRPPPCVRFEQPVRDASLCNTRRVDTQETARGTSDDDIADSERQYPNPEHPVIRTHPETGRRGIYVNNAFTQEIVGMDSDESAELLEILYRQASSPEYRVRCTWEPNSIAFWDNRSCQHDAASDYWPNVRRVERVTIIGDTPYYDAAEAPQDIDTSPFHGQLRRWSRS